MRSDIEAKLKAEEEVSLMCQVDIRDIFVNMTLNEDRACEDWPKMPEKSKKRKRRG